MSRARKVVLGLRELLLAIASLLLVALATRTIMPEVAQATALQAGRAAPATLPWVFPRPASGSVLTLDLTVHWYTPSVWTIVPDDHLRFLRVDGVELPLGGVRPGGLDDFDKGFDYDFGSHFAPGPVEIQIGIDNRNGQGGVGLRPRFGWRGALLVTGFVPWLLLLARWFSLDRRQTAACGLGLVLLVVYWAKTPANVRGHDMYAHLEYIEYLLRNQRIPPPFGGWSFFHPPLYYLGAACVLAAARAFHLLGLECLQAYSLLIFLVFLVASAGALRLVLEPRQRLVATLALAAWPTCILHGIRIGNDVMLYACSGVATYFLVAWWQSDRRKHLLAAAFVAALGMLAKTNAMVVVVALGLLFSYRATKHARWHQPRTWFDGGLSLLLLTCGVLLGFGNGIYWYARGRIPSWLVGNVNLLPERLRVPVDVASFVPLDVPVFLTDPFQSRGYEEANFWNALFRSALSGEWNYPGLEPLGYFWGVCLLALVLLGLGPLWKVTRAPRSRLRDAPWLWLAAGWIGSLLVLRYSSPFSCSNDFRYVLPVLVPWVVGCARAGRASRWVLLALVSGTVPLLIFL